MPEYDERELEEIFRAGLAERAREADTTHVVEPGATGRRWRTPLLAAAAAAAAIAVAVPLALQGSDGGDPTPAPTDAVDAPDPMAGWRTESWHGVSVTVPGDWAVGGSPQADGGSAGLIDCGVGAYVDRQTESGVPYVGRPIGMSDMCVVLDVDSLPAPTASYVWFDSPFGPGGAGWSNGFEAETVEVGGQKVTVATDDADLRARIVDSIEPTGPTDRNRCPAVQPETVTAAGGVSGAPDSLAVCVYDEAGAGGLLVWSGLATAAAAAEFADAVAESSLPPYATACEPTRSFGRRVILYTFGNGEMAGYVVDFECGLIRMPPTGDEPAPVALLRPETVAPWALDGVRAYVTGPVQYDADLAKYFKGLLG